MTEQKRNVVLTIFTPAYNRAHLLPRLFESIAGQVQPGDPVEWLVVDDGSKDDTVDVLEGFRALRPDLLRYISVENGGKHRAINRGAAAAGGAWMMIVDSDDRLADGAVMDVLACLAQDELNRPCSLIRGLKNLANGPVADSQFAVPMNPGSFRDWLAHQRAFDTAEVVRVDALRRCPFPEHPGERFMAEGWLWHRLDGEGLTRFVNHSWVDCEYQPEGLSAQSRRIRMDAPLGAMDVYEAQLAAGLPLRLRARAAINWWRYYFHAVRGRKSKGVKTSPALVYLPPGFLFFLRDGRLRR